MRSKSVRMPVISGDGFIELDSDQDIEKISNKRQSRYDFREIRKAVRGNPEAEEFLRKHRDLW